MAGARPSAFKKGGGFLNNVDGVIVDYEFTDDIITKDGREPFKAGKYKTGDGKMKERFHSLNAILSVRVDGAEEAVTTTLFAGGAEDYDISDDGKTLTPVSEGGGIGANTGWGKFITSLVEAGFPEDNLPEDDINFEAILGTRARFVQRVDDEATKKFGKRKSKDGKKEYARTDLVVDQVYEVGDGTVEEVAPAKKGAKPATGKVVTKGKPAQEDDEEVDPSDVAEEALKRYLADNDGSLAQPKLRMKVLGDKAFKGNSELREAVIKHLLDDKWLKAVDGVSYDPKDKAKMVSLEE